MHGRGKSDKAGAVGQPAVAELEFTLRNSVMKSPFPGMDPFIEARNVWGDFHGDFIVGLKPDEANLLADITAVRKLE
jgi:hypothetical protein